MEEVQHFFTFLRAPLVLSTAINVNPSGRLLESLEELFRDHFNVSMARDGRRGLNLFKSQRPDLVLLDLKLPGMDGVDVLKCIREDSRTVPVIVMTGYSTIERAEECVNFRACAYIRKPFDPFDLLEKVRMTLKESEKTDHFGPGDPVSDVMSRPSRLIMDAVRFIDDHYSETQDCFPRIKFGVAMTNLNAGAHFSRREDSFATKHPRS